MLSQMAGLAVWYEVLYSKQLPSPCMFADRRRQLLGFLIVGSMLLFTIQALGEMAVLYPVNGAFFSYGVRFIDEAWYVTIFISCNCCVLAPVISNAHAKQGICNGLGLRYWLAHRVTFRDYSGRYHD